MPSLGVLAPALLAPSAAAQVDFFSDADTLSWPFDQPELVQGRAVAGDLSGDLLPDAVFLRAGKPVVVYGPAAYQSAFALDLDASDVALLPADEPGGASALVVVNAAGAWKLAGYDAGSFQTTPFAAPSWAGATRVVIGDTDADGAPDLVGLSASGDLLLLEDLAAPAPTEVVLPMAAAVLDLLPLDWDGAAGDELAVLRPDGLLVLAPDGSTIATVGVAASAGFLLPLREAALARERCVLVRTAPGPQLVAVVDALEVEPPLDFGPAAGLFGGDTSDVDGDGNDDLYLVGNSSHQTLLLLNQGPAASTTFSFGPQAGELIEVAPGAASPTWGAWPLLHDFGLDGDPDLLVFVEAAGELRYLDDLRLPMERGQVQVLGGSYLYWNGLDQGELRLNLRAPTTLPFAASHVQVIGWIQPDALYGGLEALPAAVASDAFPLDASGKALAVITLDEPDLFTPNVYHFDVRAAQLTDPERQWIASGPPAVHAFTTPEVLTGEIEAQFGPGVHLRTLVIGSPGGGKPTVKALLGPPELAERQLAPAEIKTVRVPPIALPPDPF